MVQWLGLSGTFTTRTRVQSLIRELRSLHLPCELCKAGQRQAYIQGGSCTSFGHAVMPWCLALALTDTSTAISFGQGSQTHSVHGSKEEAGLGAPPGCAVREGGFGTTGSSQEAEVCLLFPVMLLIFIGIHLEWGSLLPLEMNACLPGGVWNATPRSRSPLERNIGFWTQA